ncbi:ABC transporter ATP-binding protein [Amycolatopsis lurida]
MITTTMDDTRHRVAADRLLVRMLRTGLVANVVLFAVTMTSAVAMLLLPAAVAGVVDAQLAGGRGSAPLVKLAIVLVLLVACEVAAQLAGPWCTASSAARLRHDTVGHLLRLGVRGGRSFATGDVVSRVATSAPEAASVIPSLIRGVSSLVTAIGGVVALGLIDIWLALTFLLGVPVGLLMVRSFVTEVTSLVMRYQVISGSVSARLTDALAGIRTIRAAGTVDRETRRILTPLPRLHAAGLGMWQAQGKVGWRASALAPMIQVAVLSVAGLALAEGRITAGELLSASGYALLGLAFFEQAAVFMAVGRARASARRLAEVQSEPLARTGDEGLPDGPGELVLRAVTVREGAEVVLDNVSMTVPAGSSVAVVGQSGSGKSMLAAVAGRLVAADDGDVLLDGVSLSALAPAALRREVSYAFERPSLLGTTVADAIALGRADASAAKVEAAARTTHSAEFIRRLPRGYDTPLAQAPLSGGEAQRLGLARAVAQGGRLIILDDATSSLDTITEQQVSSALLSVLHGRTRLIVAHRAATAARADLVAWLENGRIRALAPHDQLLARPDYRRIFHTEPADGGQSREEASWRSNP